MALTCDGPSMQFQLTVCPDVPQPLHRIFPGMWRAKLCNINVKLTIGLFFKNEIQFKKLTKMHEQIDA